MTRLLPAVRRRSRDVRNHRSPIGCRSPRKRGPYSTPKHTPIPGEAWRGDQILTIVGRQYVFVDIYDPIRQWASETPVLTIYGWESDQTPLFVPNIDRVPDSLIGPGEDGWIPWQAEIDRVDNEARAARRRAVALLQINLSLACRNGLDAILAHRAQRQRPQS
jgi:hypothetical protein